MSPVIEGQSERCNVTCQGPGSAGNERVCIICTLLREILSARPPSLIYNSFVYGKSSPVFTAQDTIKWVLLLHTPSICHPVILKEVFLQCNFLHISKFFLLLLMQPVTDVVIVGLFGHCTTRSLLIRCFCPDSEPRRAKITLNTVCHDFILEKTSIFLPICNVSRVTSQHFFSV